MQGAGQPQSRFPAVLLDRRCIRRQAVCLISPLPIAAQLSMQDHEFHGADGGQSSIPLKGLLESHGADSGHLRSCWKAPRREQALDCSRRECYNDIMPVLVLEFVYVILVNAKCAIIGLSIIRVLSQTSCRYSVLAPETLRLGDSTRSIRREAAAVKAQVSLERPPNMPNWGAVLKLLPIWSILAGRRHGRRHY
jgi:hypothetical protein